MALGPHQLPAGHASHDEAPLADWKVPAGQMVQTRGGPMAVMAVPAGQPEHWATVVAPGSKLYLPFGHLAQAVSAASPVWLDQRPAEHWEHWSSEVAPGS